MSDIHIFHRVNVEMTRGAIESANKAGMRVWLADNSELGEAVGLPYFTATHYDPRVYSFAALHNHIAIQRVSGGYDGYFWMHNDCRATPQVFDALRQAVADRRPETGAVFTNYDTLCWFSAKAVLDVGGWDLRLPQYFSDNDLYRRLRLAGYTIEETGLQTEHLHSNTLSDPYLRLLNDATFPLYKSYYVAKWGGEPPNEQYATPFKPYLHRYGL